MSQEPIFSYTLNKEDSIWCCTPVCTFRGDIWWAPIKEDPSQDPDLIFNENTGSWEPPGGWLPFPSEIPGYTSGGYEPFPGTSNSCCYWKEYDTATCNHDAALAEFRAAVLAVDPYAGTKYQAEVCGYSGIMTYCRGQMTQAECEARQGIVYTSEENCTTYCYNPSGFIADASFGAAAGNYCAAGEYGGSPYYVGRNSDGSSNGWLMYYDAENSAWILSPTNTPGVGGINTYGTNDGTPSSPGLSGWFDAYSVAELVLTTGNTVCLDYLTHPLNQSCL